MTDELKKHPELADIVTAKSDIVRREITNATVRPTWELRKDSRDRQLLRLRLTDDFNGQGTADFAPDELRHERNFALRLHELNAAVVRVACWRQELRALFADLRAWCQKLPGGATVVEEPYTANEGLSGEYEVTRLVVTRNGQTMEIEPVGAWIIGAEGRVNLNGLGGPLILLYFGANGGWSYQEDRFPSQLIALTERLFLQLAEACLDG